MTNVVMPKLGLTMEEGTITAWKVKVGDRVQEGEVLCEVETDKLTNQIEAKVAGRVREIRVAEDETVACQTVIAVLE